MIRIVISSRLQGGKYDKKTANTLLYMVRSPPPVGLYMHAFLGVKHFLFNPAYVLLVLGLVFIVRKRDALVYAMIIFVAGHSTTLILSALEIVTLPQKSIIPMIYMCILLLAGKLTRIKMEKPTFFQGFPLAVAFAGGLVSGFGFGGSLGEVGLPQEKIPMALLSFNGGIEVGMLLFIAILLFVRAVARPIMLHSPLLTRWILPYAIGSFAALKIFESIGVAF